MKKKDATLEKGDSATDAAKKGTDAVKEGAVIKGKNKEQAILEAAEYEFMEKGFEAAKTTKIASLAGVTHAMLHYYYRTKENLFDMVFERKTRLLKDSLFGAFDRQDLPFCEKIRQGIEAHFDFLKANPTLPRFVINEVIYKPGRMKLFEHKIRSVAENVLEKLSAEIDREVEKGTIVAIDPVTLLVDIASVNVFAFAVLPFLRNFAVKPYGSEEAFLEARKRENVEIIMRRLKR
ncbi:MAG: TetR/AcrR family transcriptional regulator [Tannerella sp.]|jgi:AcrR family transcriptional regulator|nr:TetR/AcrR family transcriptional regulator [Tannerella sp.]